MNHRIEHDSFGEVRVPADAFFGAQTQRAVENFDLSGEVMPRAFIRALGLVKAAAAQANRDLGLLAPDISSAIQDVSMQISRGELDSHFPVGVFQTGSGTSSNMNANEVIAHCASRALGRSVHPNDHVNMSQSSNDVVPTAIHVGAALCVEEALLPGLSVLVRVIEQRAVGLERVIKTGRTHLMDAMPVTAAQEARAWAAQASNGIARVKGVESRLRRLAIGGTAVGTGINAPPGFGEAVAHAVSALTGLRFSVNPNLFEALGSQDTAVELSGQLKTVAVSLMKIANDLRWMNSGPLSGLGEVALPALQPGSSIMPGKVNPVIPEAVAMACARVIGNDASITIAGQSGNFQLNVMLPLIAHDLMQSIELLGRAARALGERAISGMIYDVERMKAQLSRNPILVTALNGIIGYEQGSKIARQAYAEGRAIVDVALEHVDLSREELERLLDPETLTRPGSPG